MNDFEHQKWKLHEGLKLLTLLHAKWQAIKHAMLQFRPPPFLGLKDLWNFSDRMGSLIKGLP